MGLVQYSAKFIPNSATIGRPIMDLTRKHVKFVWGNEQQSAFERLKSLISRADTLAYFKNDCKTRIIADASPVGLGAVLTQLQDGLWRVISYASRSLSDVERRYSQTEKEALGLVWACERFYCMCLEKNLSLKLIINHLNTFILKPQNRRHALSDGFCVYSLMILMLYINQVLRILLMLYRD